MLKNLNISYDSVADAIYIKISSGKVFESKPVNEGVIIDYIEDGEIIGLEILDFSKRNLDLNELIKLKLEEIISKVASE
jgi:uncharacterized protein YuzE